MGPLRQADVCPRIGGVSLPQFRIARVREHLVHPAASHHITAQEQGQQTITHPAHSARPPAAPLNRRPALKLWTITNYVIGPGITGSGANSVIVDTSPA
jgi:hypothetical protein